MDIDISITVSNDNAKFFKSFSCNYLVIDHDDFYLNKIIDQTKKEFGQEISSDGIKIKIKVVGW